MTARIVGDAGTLIALESPGADRAVQRLVESHGPIDAAVVDHYELGEDFARAIRPFTATIVRIDDGDGRPLFGDIVIAAVPNPSDINPAPTAKRLLGPAYALLRPDFAARRTEPRRFGVGRKRALVTLGASTPAERAFAVAGELAKIEDLDVRVVCIAQESLVAPPRVEVIRGWSDLALEIDRADLILSAGGGTLWERCVIGIPGLVLITAENQRANVNAIARAGAGIVVGEVDRFDTARLARAAEALINDPEWAAEMAENAWALCDGQGATRVARAIDPPLDRMGVPVYIRPTTSADKEILYSWQCDPTVRRYARNPAPPSWDAHVAWFAQRLSSPRCKFQMIESDRATVGMVRADRVADGWEISIIVAPEFAGRGIGRLGLLLIAEVMPRERLVAEISPANLSSRRMFETAGYLPLGNNRYALDRTHRTSRPNDSPDQARRGD